ncbi:MAG: DUF2835 family protein [Pseudomonadota bacterium]
MRTFTIDMRLNRTQLEAFYAGQVSHVWVRDVNGVRLQFPLQHLRPFIDHNGVRGRFTLQVKPDNSLLSIKRA